MKRLFFFFLLFGLFVQAQGQHPSFQKSFSYAGGAVSDLIVDNERMWYLAGMRLETALFLFPDSLVVLDERDLNFVPADIEKSENVLAVTGQKTVVFRLDDNGTPSAPFIFDNKGISLHLANGGFFVKTQEGLSFLKITDTSDPEWLSLPLSGPFTKVLSRKDNLVTITVSGDLNWYTFENPMDLVKKGSLTVERSGFVSDLTDTSLWCETENGLTVYSLDPDLGLNAAQTIELPEELDMSDLNSIRIQDSVVTVNYQDIVELGYVYKLTGNQSLIWTTPNTFFVGPVVMTVNGNQLVILTDDNKMNSIEIPTGSAIIKYKGTYTFGPSDFSNPILGDNWLVFDNMYTWAVFDLRESEPMSVEWANSGTTDVITTAPTALIKGNEYRFSHGYGIYSINLNHSDSSDRVAEFSDILTWIEPDSAFVYLSDSFFNNNSNLLFVYKQKPDKTYTFRNWVSGHFNDLFVTGDSLFVADLETGILIGNLNEQGIETEFVFSDTILVSGGVRQTRNVNGVVVAEKSNRSLVFFSKTPEGEYELKQSISYHPYREKVLKVIGSFLLVGNEDGGSDFVDIFDCHNPDSPIKIGSFPSLGENRGIDVTASSVVISHGRYGFTLYDYTGYKVGVENPNQENPKGFAIESVYPNPFNPTATIAYRVPVAGEVTMTVYDLTGREIARLVNGKVGAGYHEVPFHAPGLASGVYLVRIQLATGQQATARMMLVK